MTVRRETPSNTHHQVKKSARARTRARQNRSDYSLNSAADGKLAARSDASPRISLKETCRACSGMRVGNIFCSMWSESSFLMTGGSASGAAASSEQTGVAGRHLGWLGFRAGGALAPTAQYERTFFDSSKRADTLALRGPGPPSFPGLSTSQISALKHPPVDGRNHDA